MFESKLNRGKAGGYAPLDGTGKVPLDKLPPIQSTIDTGSLVTNSQTGSFATTGSNIFTGEQTIATIQGTGSLYLKPDSSDFRQFEIYNTSPSDTHIKANGGLSFFGDDTNYLKIDDASGDVTIAAFSDIILDPDDGGVYIGSYSSDNGVITNGYLNAIIGDTDIINGGTGNSITDVIGRIPTVDSASLATTGSNQFSGSQTITGSLTLSDEITFTNTASIQLASTLAITAPSTGIPNSVSNWNGQGGWNQMFYSNVATTGGTGTGLTVDVAAGSGGYINIEAISINTPGSGYTDGDVIAINNENNLPGTFVIGTVAGDSWTFGSSGLLTTPGGINVNGQVVVDGGHLILTGSDVPTSSTGSLGDREGTVVFDDNYLYYCTARFEPETYTIVIVPGTTYNTHVSIPKNQGIPALSSNNWSITTQDNTTYILTGVYSDNDNWDCEIDNLNSTYNGGIQIVTLTNLNYAPADIWKTVSLDAIDTGSFATTSSLQTLVDVTGSFVTNSQTGSFAKTSSNAFTGSQIISGSLTITGSISGGGIVTSSNVSTIQTITSASYAGLTPVSGTLYIIIG